MAPEGGPRDEDDTADLLGRWAEARGAPGAVPTEEWLRRHPARAESLRAGMEVIRGLEPGEPESRGARPPGPESVFAALQPDGAPRSPLLLPEEERDLPPVIVPRPGAEGRYRIVGEIARGGIGVVLRGHDVDLGRDVAMKVLREEHAERADVLQRFVEEAQIGGQLQHPGIVPIYDVGLGRDRRPYFTMKLVKGQTLAALLTERKHAAEDRRRFLTVFESVCQTVAYAHARSVIHRDLKPSNVMVGAFGEVLVVDWGLAKVLRRGGVADEQRAEPRAADQTVVATHRSGPHGSESVVGSVMGTPSFMAPEQARGEVDRIDERADVFALGAMLCEILTGSPPYLGTPDEVFRQAAAGNTEGARARLAAGETDKELTALTTECLAAEPLARPRDAAAVAGRVAAYLASLDEKRRLAEAEAERATLRAAEERKRRRLSVALAATAVGLVVLVGGGFLWIESERDARAATVGRQIAAELDEAHALHARAAASPAEATLWVEALAAARRAGALARSDDVETPVREAASAAVARIEAEAQAAERRTRETRADLALVERLEEIRERSAEHFSSKQRDRECAAALKESGFDVEGTPEPRALGERIRASRVRDAVVVALDNWRRSLERRQESTARLDEVLDAADPDPWRRRLRAATGVESLLALAREADVDTLPAESVLLLVVRLGEAGETPAAAALARKVQVRNPQSFWANFHRARWAARESPAERAEAIRFATAALVLRPKSYWPHFVLGLWLGEADDVAAGIAATREALRLKPDEASVHSSLGLLLRRQGDLDGAATELREAVRLDPAFADAHYNLGVVLGLKGDLKGAVSAYREALRVDPTYGRAHTNMGNELVKLGELDAAVTAHREAVRLMPTEENAHLNLGDALKARGDLDDALAAFREAIRHQPQGHGGHSGIGAILMRKGDRAGAIASYREAVRWKPDHYDAWNNLGILLRQTGDLDAALEACRKVIDGKPDMPGAHSNLGNVLAQRGDEAGAIAAFREELRRHPKFLAAYVNLANALRRTGDPAGAMELYREALRLAPTYAPAHYATGLALAADGQPNDAMEAYRAAIRADPRHADARNNLGILLKETGDLDGAIEEYRGALRVQPRHVGAHYNLGVALRLKRDLDGAEAAFRESVRLAPEDHDAHIELGATLRQKGELDAALEHLREAIRLRPRVGEAHFELGLALLAKGELDAAVAAYREVIRLQPPYEGAPDLAEAIERALREAGRSAEADALPRNVSPPSGR